LRQGLAGAARTTSVQQIHGEFAAIDLALEALNPGDLCLILIDQVELALAYLASHTNSAPAASSTPQDAKHGINPNWKIPRSAESEALASKRATV
ncbi:MAG: hypothetical protein ABI351_04285, partial [Herbaspirillum sp.]